MGDAVGGDRLVEAGPIAHGAGEGVVFELLAHAATAHLNTEGEKIALGFDGLLFFLPATANTEVEVNGLVAGLCDEC
jgi:hypothetical protein